MPYLVPAAIFVGLWEVVAFTVGSSDFPHCWQILELTVHSFLYDEKIEYQGLQSKGFSIHILETLYFYVPGLLCGAVLGTLASLFFFSQKTVRRIIEPLLEFVRIIPPLILAPFLLLIFKDNPLAKFFIVIFYTTLSMNVYCLNALDRFNQNFINLSAILGNSRSRYYRDILLPGILPSVVGGVRINIAMSLGVLIVSESIGSFNGIGKILAVIQQFNDATYIFVCIFWAVVIVIALDSLFMLLLRRKTAWAAGSAA
jgi:ABC-type nitrate/sulfonate/bicarbonate transport system permease component